MSIEKMKESEELHPLEGRVKSLIETFGAEKEGKIVQEEIYYNTAKNFGSKLHIESYESLREKMEELGIGQVRIVLISDEKIIIQLFECFTCGEMEYQGKSVCYFEGGILAGAISNICGQAMDAKETKCNALGDDYCEFVITPVGEKQDLPQKARSTTDTEDNMMDLTLYTLKLAKSYNQVESRTKRFHNINLQLNKALKKAVEINSFNKQMLDSMPNSLALIDGNGVIVKINKQYQEFLQTKAEELEKKNVKSFGWVSQYREVLDTGDAAIWQENIQGQEYIIFESPVEEGKGILRQLIPVESEFIKLMLDKMSYLEKEMNYYKYKVMEKERGLGSIEAMGNNSEKMREVTKYMKKVSKLDATVLLRGQSGTGKSMYAKILHEESLRRNDPFVCIDCTTIPENFFEVELFGYEPGAFTGASKDGKTGKLELADGGTVFLDEIAEIPMETQSKLLRFLQEKEFERIGGVKTNKVDVRIIAATNQDLEKMIESGKFRKDLYYRLNVISITLPSLKERWEELPHLTNKILLDFCKEVGIGLKEVSEEGMKALISYDWPGNIRELENIIKRLAIHSDSGIIDKADIVKVLDHTGKPEEIGRSNTSDSSPKKMEQSEKEQIIEMLGICENNKTLTAEKLGITRQTLYNKIKRYQIIL